MARWSVRPGPNPFQHHDETSGTAAAAPFAATGAELAFVENSLERVGHVEVRVASIVPLIVMKVDALLERLKPKDSYDLNFCLDNFLGGVAALADEFTPFLAEPVVRDPLTRLAGKFRYEDDTGPMRVVEVEEVFGGSRAIRKLDAFTRVDDSLRALGLVS